MRKNLINMWITYLTLVNSEEGGRRVIFVFCHSARKNVHVLFDDVTIQNSALKPKKVFLIRLARHSVSAFDFNEIWRSATWKSFFFFLSLKTKLKNPLFNYLALWKWNIDFQLLHKKCWRKQNNGILGSKWYTFSKAFMVQ